MTQEFMNGVEQNRLYPETFEIPSRLEKSQIAVGDLVKVGFLSEEHSVERMWLIVKEVSGDGLIHGSLDNVPMFFDYRLGQMFAVRAENILSIIKTH